MNCTYHLCDNTLTGRQTKFCSWGCKNKFFVNQYRMNAKVKAVEYKGGKCSRCGYNKSIHALQFHHRDPTQKDFQISGSSRAWKTIIEELDKCDMVCANCHHEIHFGV